MGTTRRLDPGRILLGLVILTLGVLFIVEQAGWGNVGAIIGDWWPVVIIAAGVINLATSERLNVGSLIVIGAGAVLLLSTLSLTSVSLWSFFWPLVLVIVGLSVIFGRAGFGGHQATTAAKVNRFALFSGHEVVSEAVGFHGGWVGAFFGGLTLDLRQARLAPEGAQVDATVLFGGIDVLVPHGWQIELTGVPIFGGFDDKTRVDEPLAADAPVLKVNAFTMFGGLSVKHEK